MPRTTGQEPQKMDFWGCESVDVGKVNGDSFAYIATLEAFHGNPLVSWNFGLVLTMWKERLLQFTQNIKTDYEISHGRDTYWMFMEHQRSNLKKETVEPRISSNFWGGLS